MQHRYLAARGADPRDAGVGLQVARSGEGVGDVALHAQGQRLDALEEEPRVVWA